jgi:uncharacterized protein
VGIPFYREAAEIFAGRLLSRCRIRQTFQTNGTLITDSWCEYFIESQSAVGVSLDGPKEIHDAQRSGRDGRASFEQVMRGISALRDHNIPLNGLCVLTPASLRQPERLFEFFLSEKFLNVAFNVEESKGEHGLSLLGTRIATAEIRQAYASFMARFLDENERYGTPLTVREFNILSRRLIQRARDRSFLPEEPENFVGRIVTVSHDGEVFSWSPELASGVLGNVAYFSLGNVHSVASLDELLDGPKSRQIQAAISDGVEQCKKSCSYFCVCGGGLPSNKFYEHGTFRCTETLRCQLQVQTLADLLLSRSRSGARAGTAS